MRPQSYATDMPPPRATLPGPALRALFLLARARLPSDCPLCGGAARGGRLCCPCESMVRDPLRHPPRQSGIWRCPRCAVPLPRRDAPCPDCAAHQAAGFDRAIIALDYAPPADALVLSMKSGRLELAGLFGELLADAARRQAEPLPEGLILAPIPASRASLRGRGFNPAAEIARALGRDLRLPVRLDLLLRTREQTKQSRLDRTDRMRAVRDLYAGSRLAHGRHIGLVDDVMTTGSTLRAAASALKAAGAASVTALAVARAPAPYSAHQRAAARLQSEINK